VAESTVSSKNAELIARAERVMAGGAPGGNRLPAGTDFVVARGEGARVWDVDGREYLDFVLGSGPMILGHAHPAVAEAVSRQLRLGTQYYMTSEPTIELAETIVEAAGGDGLVKFASTGSEAVGHAIRLARAFTGRSKLLKFEGGYHGGQDGELLSVSPPQAQASADPLPDSAGIPAGVRQDVVVAPYNDLEQTGRLLAQHAGDLAAVLIEPQQRGINPALGFLSGLRELTRQHDTLLIFDEVVTGFRLAFGGAREFYGVQPDLAAYAKIIGGGFPLSAIWGQRAVMAAADPLRRDAGRVQIRGTLSGNPLAAAAGLATIEQLRHPGVYDRLHALGARLRQGLVAAAGRQHVPLQVVGDGPLAAISFTDQPLVDYRGVVEGDKARLTRVGAEMIRRGILVNLDTKFYLSLAHTDADVDRAAEAFEESLAATPS
jgi:glutamate-1-semialdehyde 2,1-aminomutase